MTDLTDEDRAAIAAAWVGCAFGNGGARAIQAAAEATYAAGLAAGRARTIDECITACDREREIYQLGPPGSLQNDAQQMARSACWGCAAAIRALNARPAS